MNNRNKGRRSSPALNVSWGPPAEAADGSFSLALEVSITGHWENGRPDNVALTLSEAGTEILSEPLDVKSGGGQWPITGLVAGHHYSLLATTGGREVRRLIEVPKQKSANAIATDKNRELADFYVQLTRVNTEKLNAEPKSVVPDNLDVIVNGHNGNYKLVISVSADGKPIAGFRGKVIAGGKLRTFTTKEGGIAIHPLKFTERLKNVEVQAGTQQWDCTLPGI